MRISEYDSKPVLCTEDALSVFRAILCAEDPLDQDREQFWVMGINCGSRIKYVELVSMGLQDQALVHPGSVFRYAIIHGALKVIIAHQHPSGDPQPSSQDNKVTNLMVEAGKLLGITVLDHIVFTQDRYYSYRECHRL